MSTNVQKLSSKIIFIQNARYVKDELNLVEEYPAIPETPQQEQDIIKDLLFAFLKRNFPGCRIRVNTHSIMLRLDGQIHRKANKLREVLNDNHEWRTWLESNHRETYVTYRRNQISFERNAYVDAQAKGDKRFIYIPFKPNRISGYTEYGIKEMFKFIDNERLRDVALAGIYEETIALIEQETLRREEERRKKYEEELAEYMQELRQGLFQPISALEESKDPADNVLGSKLRTWARENNKAPIYAVPLTYDRVVPVGTKVKLVAPPGELEKEWHAVPTFEGYTVKEGFELKKGWGKVTKFDPDGERSRGGTAPIVVQDHIYTQFDVDYWKHLIPAEYDELLEVIDQIRAEHADEMAEAVSAAEREKAMQEQLAEERRLRQEEEEKRLREEAERAQRLEEQRLLALQEEERQRIQREEEEERQRRAERAARAEEEMKEREERQERLRQQLRQQVAEQAQTRLDQAGERTTAQAPQPQEEAAPVERRPAIYARQLGERHVYVLFTGTQERTYVRRGNAINAYVNAFDGAPTAIFDYENPTAIVEHIE